MIIRKFISVFVFFILFQFSHANNYNDRISDSIEVIKFPINLKLYVNLEDLNDVEIKNNYFNSRLRYEISSENNFTLGMVMAGFEYEGLTDFIDLKYFENLTSNIGSAIHLNDSVKLLSYRSMYAQFDHNWNVRNYPFDNPQLKLQFTAKNDSSFVSLNQNEIIFSSFSEKMENLKDGFIVNSITIKKDYFTSENDPLDVKDTRNKVLERLTFYVNLDRSGSWLYLKLFLGSFLAFVISWLVFFIPKEDFSSRIELSVGAIFGAVGNRAYVESIMPDVQVFTKADMINNTMILLIIFNIIIIMIQRNKLIELEFFESSRNSAIYTAFIFVVINVAILLW